MKNIDRLLATAMLGLTATQASANIIAEVPEPATLSLLLIGLFGLGLARKRIKSVERN